MKTNTYSGTVKIGGKEIFFRSAWECNVAAYFEFLKSHGQIADWEYEPTTFWFEKIRRGVRSYKPDFRITENDGSQYYVEVKGWMDDKSRTKLNRMRIYHPEIKVDLIDSNRYNEIKKKAAFIPNWGLLERGKAVAKEKCALSGCKNNLYQNTLCRKHYKKVYNK